jgi:hypothetical protein
MGEMLEARQLGDRPLFYLDAHWYDYWPLCDEIRLISNHLHEAIIIIDDFEVPGRNDCSFDVYKSDSDPNVEYRCGLPLIQPCFGSSHHYHALFPNYTLPEDSKLTGYIVLLQNLNEHRLRTLVDAEFVKNHFKEYPVSSNRSPATPSLSSNSVEE